MVIWELKGILGDVYLFVISTDYLQVYFSEVFFRTSFRSESVNCEFIKVGENVSKKFHFITARWRAK
jgi:hypothetical protein